MTNSGRDSRDGAVGCWRLRNAGVLLPHLPTQPVVARTPSSWRISCFDLRLAQHVPDTLIVHPRLEGGMALLGPHAAKAVPHRGVVPAAERAPDHREAHVAPALAHQPHRELARQGD